MMLKKAYFIQHFFHAEQLAAEQCVNSCQRAITIIQPFAQPSLGRTHIII